MREGRDRRYDVGQGGKVGCARGCSSLPSVQHQAAGIEVRVNGPRACCAASPFQLTGSDAKLPISTIPSRRVSLIRCSSVRSASSTCPPSPAVSVPCPLSVRTQVCVCVCVCARRYQRLIQPHVRQHKQRGVLGVGLNVAQSRLRHASVLCEGNPDRACPQGGLHTHQAVVLRLSAKQVDMPSDASASTLAAGSTTAPRALRCAHPPYRVSVAVSAGGRPSTRTTSTPSAKSPSANTQQPSVKRPSPVVCTLTADVSAVAPAPPCAGWSGRRTAWRRSSSTKASGSSSTYMPSLRCARYPNTMQLDRAPTSACMGVSCVHSPRESWAAARHRTQETRGRPPP
jgi:hypothetical protein